MRLYDTMARAVVPIEPATPGLLRLYACGPTVYRYAHVGNMRTFLLSDLIRRVAELHHVRVRVVQNITDVGHMTDDTNDSGDDKVLAQARREGKTAAEIAAFYTEAFHRDLAALNIHRAADEPKASEWIRPMVELVQRLIDRGHAYATPDGSVFFDAASWAPYGAISGNRLDQLVAGHRSEGEVHPHKRFHADWALWKGAGPNRAQVWETPWGTGFPGWHLECSAMSLALLGETIDVHTGGIDLRFPHHEDERAQSEAAVGHEVVRHWVHGEHLLFEGRKMAKSTGNVVLVPDVEARGHDPLALRLSFLGSRYRTQINLTWDEIAAADKTLARWRSRVREWAESPSKPMCAEYVERFRDALADDLDTPAALQVVREAERDPEMPDGSKFELFAWFDNVLGLDLARDVGKAAPSLPEGARALLDARAAARAGKDFAASDRLRDELAALGVAVRDTANGQEWSPA
ncbi:MAG TPA: cysteine--tRNA ligase [Mycobacteriales bacterium]|jgi:cysteinyl-tRNA synthetase|nr:cysteine--tRNA ligase [Mycobacteriales bacterium]